MRVPDDNTALLPRLIGNGRPESSGGPHERLGGRDSQAPPIVSERRSLYQSAVGRRARCDPKLSHRLTDGSTAGVGPWHRLRSGGWSYRGAGPADYSPNPVTLVVQCAVFRPADELRPDRAASQSPPRRGRRRGTRRAVAGTPPIGRWLLEPIVAQAYDVLAISRPDRPKAAVTQVKAGDARHPAFATHAENYKIHCCHDDENYGRRDEAFWPPQPAGLTGTTRSGARRVALR